MGPPIARHASRLCKESSKMLFCFSECEPLHRVVCGAVNVSCSWPRRRPAVCLLQSVGHALHKDRVHCITTRPARMRLPACATTPELQPRGDRGVLRWGPDLLLGLARGPGSGATLLNAHASGIDARLGHEPMRSCGAPLFLHPFDAIIRLTHSWRQRHLWLRCRLPRHRLHHAITQEP